MKHVLRTLLGFCRRRQPSVRRCCSFQALVSCCQMSVRLRTNGCPSWVSRRAVITPLPGATPTKPGSATLPFFGVEAAILDDKGNEVEGPGQG